MEEKVGNFCTSTIDNSEIDSDNPYGTMFEDDELDDEDIEFQQLDKDGNPVGVPECDNDLPYKESQDKYIGSKVPLPINGEIKEGKIVSRKRDAQGDLVGTETDNPITDSRVYQVEFGDGSYGEYSTKIIAENLFAHVDDDGRSHAMLTEIIDHQTSEAAIPVSDGILETAHGTKRKKITTKGWELKVEWCDGTSSWIPLKDLKEANPIDVAQYAQDRNLLKEPGFAWWAPTVRMRGEQP
jgi:hypothetical protein